MAQFKINAELTLTATRNYRTSLLITSMCRTEPHAVALRRARPSHSTNKCTPHLTVSRNVENNKICSPDNWHDMQPSKASMHFPFLSRKSSIVFGFGVDFWPSIPVKFWTKIALPIALARIYIPPSQLQSSNIFHDLPTSLNGTEEWWDGEGFVHIEMTLWSLWPWLMTLLQCMPFVVAFIVSKCNMSIKF